MALVENQIEKIIKVLRMDNGGDLLKLLCKKCAIERHKTTPYTPQHNGLAERMNMMLMEKKSACSVVLG